MRETLSLPAPPPYAQVYRLLELSVQRIDGTHEKTAALGKAKAAMGDAGRFPLKPEVPRPEDYPVKKNIKEHSEIFLDKWGFFTIVFHIRGTLFFFGSC